MSPKRKNTERETVFKRLENVVFHRLRDKERSVSVHSGDSKRPSRRSTKGGKKPATRILIYEERSLLKKVTETTEHPLGERLSSPKVRMVEADIGSLGLRNKVQAWRMVTWQGCGRARRSIRSLLAFATLIYQKGPACQTTSRHMTEARTRKITSRFSKH